jgi:hypothetical protein
VNLPAFTTQAPGELAVHELGFEEILWSYDSDPSIRPRKFFGDKLGYQTKIDPTPCHGHDLGLIEETLQRCHELAPLCNPVTVSILRLVDRRSSNGWAQQQWDSGGCYTPDDCQCDIIELDGETTKKKRRRNWDGIIVLSGRLTEIHPAIGRYVVPHEYAHILEDALGLIRHDGDGDPGRRLLRDWAKARRIPQEAFELSYMPANHHLIPGEVFANDFRYWVAGAETEWWPHHDVCTPLGARGTKRAQAWWDDAVGELRDCYRQARKALET